MARLALILIGSVSAGLAVAGAILPALPSTPFVLVALWAFARSSKALHDWLTRIPLLRGALIEARRFEANGAVRAPVKLTALAFAWGAVLLLGATTGWQRSALLALVAAAAAAATVFMWWVPTEQGQGGEKEIHHAGQEGQQGAGRHRHSLGSRVEGDL